MSTITCTYDEFRRIVADFLKAADTANYEELEAGEKCVGLAYLGIQWDDNNPIHAIHRAAGAPACLRLVTQKVVEREVALDAAHQEQMAQAMAAVDATYDSEYMDPSRIA